MPVLTKRIQIAFRHVGLVPFDLDFVKTLEQRGSFNAYRSLAGQPVTKEQFVEQKALEVLQGPSYMRYVEAVCSPRKRRVPMYSLPVDRTSEQPSSCVFFLRYFLTPYD
jgi:hypothetical protein